MRFVCLQQLKPQPDDIYEALIDLMKNGIPPHPRTKEQQEAYAKKVKEIITNSYLNSPCFAWHAYEKQGLLVN